MTTQTIKEKAREEFAKYYTWLKASGGGSVVMIKGISDFIDSTIDSAIKEREESLIKEIEGMKNNDYWFDIGKPNEKEWTIYKKAINDVINLIKSK